MAIFAQPADRQFKVSPGNILSAIGSSISSAQRPSLKLSWTGLVTQTIAGKLPI